jgi:tetratricopeptide (TPR) repeat protein
MRNILRAFFFILLQILVPTVGHSSASTPKLDSLYTELKTAKFDSVKVEIYLSIIEESYRNNPEDVIPLSEELISIIENALKTANKEYAHNLLAVKANCFNNIGAIHNQRGDIKKALFYFHKSLAIKESLGEKKAMSSTLNNIGYLYESLSDYPNALLNYKRSLKLKEDIGDKKGIARLYNNLGSLYEEMNDSALTLDAYRKSLELSEVLGDKLGMALTLNNIGYFYDKQHASKTAFDFYERSLKIRNEIDDQQGIAESLNNLGAIYLKENNTPRALEYGLKSLAISKKLGYPEYIKRASNLLREVYLKQKNYALAYQMYDLYITMKDSILNEENRNEAIKKSFEFEYEKKVTADSIRNNELKKIEQLQHEHEITKQRSYTYFGIIGFVLMLFIAVLSFKAFKQKQKANDEITKQKRIIEDKQKEIIDSINYAKRIQQSILPTSKYIDSSIKRLKK